MFALTAAIHYQSYKLDQITCYIGQVSTMDCL